MTHWWQVTFQGTGASLSKNNRYHQKINPHRTFDNFKFQTMRNTIPTLYVDKNYLMEINASKMNIFKETVTWNQPIPSPMDQQKFRLNFDTQKLGSEKR